MGGMIRKWYVEGRLVRIKKRRKKEEKRGRDGRIR